MRSGTSSGMHSFNESLLNHFRANRITYETGLASAHQPRRLALASKGMSTTAHRAVAETNDAPVDVDWMKLLRLAVQKSFRSPPLRWTPPMLRVTKLEPLSLQLLTNADMRSLHTVLSTRQRSTYELERELDFALSLDNGRRFRVNAYYQQGHMAASLRAIPAEIPDPRMLGLPEHILSLADRPHGLMLVVGPTGSGKTTTLSCLVDRINRNRPAESLRLKIQSSMCIAVEKPLWNSASGLGPQLSRRTQIHSTPDPDVILSERCGTTKRCHRP